MRVLRIFTDVLVVVWGPSATGTIPLPLNGKNFLVCLVYRGVEVFVTDFRLGYGLPSVGDVVVFEGVRFVRWII